MKKNGLKNDIRKMRGFLENVRQEKRIHQVFIKNSDELFESLDELILLMDAFSKEEVLKTAHRLARRTLESERVEDTLADMRKDVAVRRQGASDRKVDWVNFAESKTNWLGNRR